MKADEWRTTGQVICLLAVKAREVAPEEQKEEEEEEKRMFFFFQQSC